MDGQGCFPQVVVAYLEVCEGGVDEGVVGGVPQHRHDCLGHGVHGVLRLHGNTTRKH